MNKTFSPDRLDVAAWAQAQGALSQDDALAHYPRLAAELRPGHEGHDTLRVHWQAQGGQRKDAQGQRRAALHLQVQAQLPLTCQRCLGEVQVPLQVDRHFIFVPDEDTAAALDEASDDADVLVLDARFDLRALIEDELLMALPLVPRHAQCPQALPLSVQSADFDAAENEKPHPFAALAALKNGGAPGGQ